MALYTESEKAGAVRAYVMYGTYELAGEAVGVPWQTIAAWKHADPLWWDRSVAKVALDLIEKLSESDQSALRRVRTRVIALLADRLERGDQKLNVKTGEVVRVEVPAKELSAILHAVGGSIKDVGLVEKPKTQEERLAELRQLGEEDLKIQAPGKFPVQ